MKVCLKVGTYSSIENLKVTQNLDQGEIFYVCHNVASNNQEILAISMFQHYTSYNQNMCFTLPFLSAK